LDWAGNPVDHKSITGILWTLCGAPIGWSSWKQSSIVLSSMEGEYVAMTKGTRDTLWYQNLLSNLDHPMRDPTPIFMDNQSAIAIVRNERFSDWTKHLEVSHDFMWEKLEDSTITLEYIPMDEQLANMLTKPLPKDQLYKLGDAMGLSRLRSP
jgi:hypothetical protein